jgi:hypothetical protein
VALWVGGPIGLWALFQAGLDNFTLFGPALAIAAGVGFARVVPRVGTGACVLGGFLLAFLPQWLSIPRPDTPLHVVPGLGPLLATPTVTNFYRPFDAFGREQAAALFDATCPDPEPLTCHVVVDQGLFYPFAEEVGHLELFFLDEDRLVLHPLQFANDLDAIPIDALSEFHCGERDNQWRDRYPGSRERLLALMTRAELAPAWWTEVSPGCTVLWFTPRGEIARLDQLPRMPDHLRGRPPPPSGLGGPPGPPGEGPGAGQGPGPPPGPPGGPRPLPGVPPPPER